MERQMLLSVLPFPCPVVDRQSKRDFFPFSGIAATPIVLLKYLEWSLSSMARSSCFEMDYSISRIFNPWIFDGSRDISLEDEAPSSMCLSRNSLARSSDFTVKAISLMQSLESGMRRIEGPVPRSCFPEEVFFSNSCSQAALSASRFFAAMTISRMD